MDHETEIELARHDERIKGLWRDIARSEAGQDKALGLASAELKAHLEILNNHQSDMRDQQSTFSTKESVEIALREVHSLRESRESIINTRLSAIERAMWVAIGGSAVIGALFAILVKLVFKV
jgi:hypothetical protein